jgi:Zn-dependent protease/CBS domain-containing protein
MAPVPVFHDEFTQFPAARIYQNKGDSSMRWSWRIATLFGIALYMHFTFLLLLLFIGGVTWMDTQSVLATVQAIAAVLLLFGIVVLHELGHALTARRFGVRTRDIILLPIGGMARLERMPEKPMQELLVAVAGPAVNIALAAIALTLMAIFGTRFDSADSGPFGAHPLVQFALINIVLAVFNMLPAFPMDGGRVLRALLAMRWGAVRATNIAAALGKVMAVIFALGSFFMSPLLLLIAIFVWFGASSEASMVQMRAALTGARVRDAMVRDFHVVRATEPIAVALEMLMSGFQHDFPVVEDGRIVGFLHRRDLMAAPPLAHEYESISTIMHRDFATIRPDDALEQAIIQMREAHQETMPVVQEGRILGLLTLENLSEYIQIRNLRHGTRPA